MFVTEVRAPPEQQPGARWVGVGGSSRPSPRTAAGATILLGVFAVAGPSAASRRWVPVDMVVSPQPGRPTAPTRHDQPHSISDHVV